MTKHPRKRAHPRPQPKPAIPKKAISPVIPHKKRSLVIFTVIAILAAIPFSLGKYIEFNSPGAFDSGAYIYSAKHILDGARIGIDEKPSAQAGTLLVNMLGVWLFGFNETGPKLMQTILQAVALIVMFVAMRRLFGTAAAAVGVIVASVYLSAPLLAKFGNVKEQYMIACMVIGISCFILYQLGGRWYHVLLAGAFVSWGPLFKQTGVSAIMAIGVFVLAQPLLRHKNYRQTGIDILLLIAGAVVSLAPVYLWLIVERAPISYWPYSFASKPFTTVLEGSFAETPTEPINQPIDSNAVQNKPGTEEKSEKKGLISKILPDYVTGSWKILSAEQRKQPALRVLRYYWLLLLPISLAIASIIARIVKMFYRHRPKLDRGITSIQDRLVLLFGIWWFFDMALVWVSPRSYEQYYLPLNASAAMLGGYLIGIYQNRFQSDAPKTKWLVIGFLGLWLMMLMSWHIFFGITKAPHSGTSYGSRQRGYVQRLSEINQRRKDNSTYSWERVGRYIHEHSTPNDKIYVWGWWPGIYVAAQRLSSAPKAFEGTMHTLSPQTLSDRIDEILTAFKKIPPKFIVDSRKRHFPWDRPPYELWPVLRKYMGVEKEGFLPKDPNSIAAYDRTWMGFLRERYGDNEAQRYKAMEPFRKYVMENYELAEPRQYIIAKDGQLVDTVFEPHVVFRRKDAGKKKSD